MPSGSGIGHRSGRQLQGIIQTAGYEEQQASYTAMGQFRWRCQVRGRTGRGGSFVSASVSTFASMVPA